MHLKLEDFEFFVNKELKEIFEKNNNVIILNKEKFIKGELSSFEEKNFTKNSRKNIFNSVFEILPDILIYDKGRKILYKKGNKSINNCEFVKEKNELDESSIFNNEFPFLTSFVNLNEDTLNKMKKIQINKIANYFAVLTKFNSIIDNLMKNENQEDKKNILEIQLIIFNLYFYLIQISSELNGNLNTIIKEMYENTKDIYSKKLFEDNFPYLKTKEEINLLL